MPHTLGYHVVKTGYGLWLPGDGRGHWSSAWDDAIGFTEPGTLHPGDPVRERMARERMKHDPVRWTPAMIDTLAATIGDCAVESPWSIAAASIEPTHLHLLITYTGLDIDRTLKWLSQRMTRAVHEKCAHPGPLFAEGRWRTFVYDPAYWQNLRHYIERHNERRGLALAPWRWITPNALIIPGAD